MSTNETSNALTTIESGYIALADTDLSEIMAEDCQGLEFTLDRVKLPAGGGIAFEIPSSDGTDAEMEKELRGIIVFNHPAYAYYTDKYSGGSNPPDCGSFDGVCGTGNPGGSCADCPYNKFGSGEGQSKACKNKRMLYILREGEIFPVVLSLPTGSLRAFTQYMKSQLTKGRKLKDVVTKISLKKATNASGITFSQAVFSFDRVLTDAEKKAVSGIVESTKSYAANLNPVSVTDLNDAVPFVDETTGEIIEPLK